MVGPAASPDVARSLQDRAAVDGGRSLRPDQLRHHLHLLGEVGRLHQPHLPQAGAAVLGLHRRRQKSERPLLPGGGSKPARRGRALVLGLLPAEDPRPTGPRFRKRRQAGLAIASINRQLEVLRRMLKLAVEWGKVEKLLPKVRWRC